MTAPQFATNQQFLQRDNSSNSIQCEKLGPQYFITAPNLRNGEEDFGLPNTWTFQACGPRQAVDRSKVW